MTAISIRLDNELKNQFQELCKNMGFTTSAMLKGLIKKVVREKKVEFSGLTENGFTPEYEKEILEYVNSDEYKNDGVLCETWKESEKFLKSL